MDISTAGTPPVEALGEKEAREAIEHIRVLADLCIFSLRCVRFTPERAYSAESLAIIVEDALRHLHTELEGWC